MAKLIKPGDSVQLVDGAETVSAVEFLSHRRVAHNLVVARIGTYFVGQLGLLVHDNTYRAPTRSIIPGYAPD